MLTRKKIAMVVAEFLGTALLTIVMLAVSKSTIGVPYFIAIAAGLTVAAAYLMLARVSGAQLNPIITLGLWTVRRMRTLPAIVFISAQLLGGMAAYILYTYLIGQDWGNAGKFDPQVLVAEALGAFVFSMGWAAVVYQRLEGGRAAAVLGLSLIAGIITASAASGGLLNPAVALGFRSWVWGTYVLGPVLGAIIGFNLYSLLFAPASELADEKPVIADDEPASKMTVAPKKTAVKSLSKPVKAKAPKKK